LLDDLDEARIAIDTVSDCLIDELKELSAEQIGRLRLRIACRTPDLPRDLKDELSKLYGRGNVSIFQLAPLQIKDAQIAAKQHNLNWESLWQEICEKNVGPLAANPVTLNLLLDLYQTDQQLPSTRTEIYQKGCMRLCGENKERHRNKDNLAFETRFEVAARMAACMIFSNRHSISTEPFKVESSEDLASLAELADEPRGEQFGQKEVFQDTILETLDTPLFQGNTTKFWTHRTFAEFLAAWYVNEYLKLEQIKDLLFIDNRIIPQLREVGAWLSSMNPEIRSLILENEPELLLRSDIITCNDELKSDLVDAILEKHDEDFVLDYHVFWWYAKLKHSNLAEQLKWYIENHSLRHDVRIVAVEVATACAEKDLQSILVNIALDKDEHIKLREEAAKAICKIGNSEQKKRLKPLALLPILQSSTRLLKQYALQSTWPEHVSTNELLNSIDLNAEIIDENSEQRAVRDAHWLGRYLPKLLEQNIETLDLSLCLRWTRHHERYDGLPSAYQAMMSMIMVMGWKSADNDEIASAFVDALLCRMNFHDPVVVKTFEYAPSISFNDLISQHPKRRQKILHLLIKKLAQYERVIHLIGFKIPFVRSEDFSHYITEFEQSASEREKKYWAQILNNLRRDLLPTDEKVSALYDICQTNAELNEFLGKPFDPISLNSDFAKQMQQQRIDYQKHKSEEEARQKKYGASLPPPPLEEVLKYLDECEAGTCESWWKISSNLSRDGLAEKHEEASIQELPIWSLLDSSQRQRVSQMAKQYLLNYKIPDDSNWLVERCAGNTFYYPAIAGYRAFYLLANLDEAFVQELPPEIWARWSDIILFYVWNSVQNSNGDPRSGHQVLLDLTEKHAPELVIKHLLCMLQNVREYDLELLLDWMPETWAEAVCNELEKLLDEDDLNLERMYVVLRYLFRHENSKATAYAESALAQPIQNNCDEFAEKQLLVARALIYDSPNAGWSLIWPVFQSEPDFAKATIAGLFRAKDYHPFTRGKMILVKLSEKQLADFYKWLCQFFPLDSDHRWGGTVTTREEFGNLRDGTVDELQHRNTDEALKELKKLRENLPNNETVRWKLAAIQDQQKRNKWDPPSPNEILEMVHNDTARWVQTGTQLLNVIISLLADFEDELQGETPDAEILWNKIIISKKFTHFMPKDENYLSDRVKNFLKRKLEGQSVFIGREVEIRKSSKTDIHIETFSKLSNNELDNRITCVIEVKGCWHKEVKTALKTQLVARYLKQNGFQYGIYLVGWFRCEEWEEEDFKSRDASKLKYTLEEARTKFEKDASEFSAENLDVRAFVLDARLFLK